MLRLQNLALETNPNKDQMLLYSDELNAPFESASNNESYCYQPSQDLESILQLAKTAKKTNECMPQKTGEWKVVGQKSPTGLDAKYALSKTSEDTWDVAIAIKVNEQSPNLMTRIKECISAVSPYMLGSNGKKLNLHILNESERSQLPSNKRPPINNIDIQDVGARSHSRAYAADVGCSTITHEVLHLLGLCDEYDGEKDGWGCRAVPSVPSIMKNHWEVYNKAVSRTLTCKCDNENCSKVAAMTADHIRIRATAWSLDPLDYAFRNKYCQGAKGGYVVNFNPDVKNKVELKDSTRFTITSYDVSTETPDKMFPVTIECQCPADDTTCKDLRDKSRTTIPSNSPQNCPFGSKPIHTAYGNVKKMNTSGDPFKITIEREAGTSMLLPSHFDRIIGGTCSVVTPNLNTCSQWAYEGTKSNSNCSGKPEICNGDDWWK
ncbi:MAG: hypothetical protein K2P81_17370 [Bacteriovoracaceae bacterium]|nr:hypothetical protein [Bacteriovoracaceae bacterium]